MTTLCTVDEKPTGDGSTICTECTHEITVALTAIPDLMDELAIMFTKRSKVPQYGTTTSPEQDAGKPMVYSVGASNAKDRIKGTLVAWARMVHEERTQQVIVGWTQQEDEAEPHPVRAAVRTPLTCQDTATSISGWLLVYLPWLRRHNAAGDLHHEITTAVAKARRLIDAAPSKKYIGMCGNTIREVTCTNELWATDDDKVIRCRICQHDWDVEDRTTHGLASAMDRIESPETIARALSAHGININAERIYNWRKRGKITPAWVDPRTRRAEYRLSDVMDVYEATQRSPQNTARTATP